MIEAKPLWAALYHSLTTMPARDYEYRRLSIYETFVSCAELTIEGNLLMSNKLVARERVELPTPAFSELTHPVFPTTSMVAVGLPNTGKYGDNATTVGDSRG